jgi:cytochrome P450
MMTFQEFLTERNLARAGAVTVFAIKSKQYGDRSQQDFQTARSYLTPKLTDATPDQRLKRIEKVLDKLLSGMINQRRQIGSHVGVSTSGHMFASNLLKKRDRNRRR